MTFEVAITADFYHADGQPKYDDFGLNVLTQSSQINHRPFTSHESKIAPQQLQGVNGVLVLTPRVDIESLADAGELLIVSRFGVGYDSVDVDACTERDVLVTITTGAVDRPVAEATIAWMLALNHNVMQKDRLVRAGQWDARSGFMGSELRDKTLGIVGLGGIGQQLVALIRGFGMAQPLACDPYAPDSVFAELGVRRVELDELLEDSDFVSLHCPLTDGTKDLIAARELELMKPTAFLLNLARGGVVDEDALFYALSNDLIAGAALDCFETEPVTEPHRLGELDNVILAPHSIAWTNELFRDIGRMACQSIVDVASGKRPYGVVNPDVLEKPSFFEKWHRIIEQK